jgi:hypothetical protein
MDSSTFMTLVIVFATWFIVSRWILPWFGIPTCCSGGSCCSVSPRPTDGQKMDHRAKAVVPVSLPENIDNTQQ